jgi:hypothetical protein
MDPTTFDSLVRTLARARSRRQLLRALAGGGIGAVAAAFGRQPARAQVCIALPCRTDPGRCAAGGSSCRCCRLPGGATECLNRLVCRASFGAIVEACGGAGAPCTEPTDCCSGTCFSTGIEGCCPTCPEGCHCNAIPRSAPSGAGQVVCTTDGGSRAACNPSAPDCPQGEVCIGGLCLQTCPPVA